jgi:hypothetical protein
MNMLADYLQKLEARARLHDQRKAEQEREAQEAQELVQLQTEQALKELENGDAA